MENELKTLILFYWLGAVIALCLAAKKLFFSNCSPNDRERLDMAWENDPESVGWVLVILLFMATALSWISVTVLLYLRWQGFLLKQKENRE